MPGAHDLVPDGQVSVTWCLMTVTLEPGAHYMTPNAYFLQPAASCAWCQVPMVPTIWCLMTVTVVHEVWCHHLMPNAHCLLLAASCAWYLEPGAHGIQYLVPMVPMTWCLMIVTVVPGAHYLMPNAHCLWPAASCGWSPWPGALVSSA